MRRAHFRVFPAPEQAKPREAKNARASSKKQKTRKKIRFCTLYFRDLNRSPTGLLRAQIDLLIANAFIIYIGYNDNEAIAILAEHKYKKDVVGVMKSL